MASVGPTNCTPPAMFHPTGSDKVLASPLGPTDKARKVCLAIDCLFSSGKEASERRDCHHKMP